MPARLKELIDARWLLLQFVKRELFVRYKNSAIGFLWSIVPPIIQVIVYTIFMKSTLNVQADNYSAYLLCGLIPWTFFSTGTLDAAQSLLVNYGIIKKVYIPREIPPLAYVLSNFVHFLLGWCVFFFVFFIVGRLPIFSRYFEFTHLPFRWEMLMFPVVTLDLLIFVIGMALWMSCLSLFYEDVKYIFQTFLGMLLFILPVIFMADNVRYSSIMLHREWLFKLYMLNPVAAVINAYRHCLLEPLPKGSLNLNHSPLPMDWGLFSLSCLVTVVFTVCGYLYFLKREWEIVERY